MWVPLQKKRPQYVFSSYTCPSAAYKLLISVTWGLVLSILTWHIKQTKKEPGKNKCVQVLPRFWLNFFLHTPSSPFKNKRSPPKFIRQKKYKMQGMIEAWSVKNRWKSSKTEIIATAKCQRLGKEEVELCHSRKLWSLACRCPKQVPHVKASAP